MMLFEGCGLGCIASALLVYIFMFYALELIMLFMLYTERSMLRVWMLHESIYLYDPNFLMQCGDVHMLMLQSLDLRSYHKQYCR